MLPTISDAKLKFAFHLSDTYIASFCTDIEAPGLIQYHHILLIHAPGKGPALCVAAEWGQLEPEHENDPVLGYFNAEGHSNCGNSIRWRDEPLFLLRAIQLARELLQLPVKLELVEGEAWALNEMQRKLALMQSEGGASIFSADYCSALADYREKIAQH
jgi:hypothetical protein